MNEAWVSVYSPDHGHDVRRKVYFQVHQGLIEAWANRGDEPEVHLFSIDASHARILARLLVAEATAQEPSDKQKVEPKPEARPRRSKRELTETGKLLAKAGMTRYEIAERMGVSYGYVTHWVNRDYIPAGMVLKLEKATEGRISRHDARPDLYPRAGFMPSDTPR